jgi:NDP-sugar pyrophosphorylase family protein
LLEDALAKGERVNAFLVHERWVDIGLPVDYERVRHGIG